MREVIFSVFWFFKLVQFRFAHALPELLVRIYVELCVSIPCDLEEYATIATSNVEADTVERTSPVSARKATQHEKLNQLLKEDSDTDYKPSTSAISDLKLSSVKTKKGVGGGRRNARVKSKFIFNFLYLGFWGF